MCLANEAFFTVALSILYECEMWCLTLRYQNKLQVTGSNASRKVHEPSTDEGGSGDNNTARNIVTYKTSLVVTSRFHDPHACLCMTYKAPALVSSLIPIPNLEAWSRKLVMVRLHSNR